MANVSSASIAGRLANDSIATSKIAAGALPSDVTVASANIVDGTIVNADISTSAAIANSKLADSGVTAGSVGSSTAIPIITVNAKGIVTGTNTTSIDSTRIDNGTSNVRVNNNNSIQMAFAGTDRFTVSNAGVDVTGTLDATGNVSVGGNLTVQNSDPYIDIVDSDHNSDFRLAASGGNFTVRDTTNGANRITLASDGTLDVAGNLDANAGIDVTGDLTVTQNASFTGTCSAASFTTNSGGLIINSQTPTISLVDSDANPDYSIRVNGGIFQISDATNGNANRIVVNSDGHVDVTGNLDAEGGVDVTGNITVTGTVDGVDIAARDTLFGGLTASSGVLTDGVTATTQAQSNNSAQVATTAYVRTAVANLVDSSPAALDTLNELAAAIGDDANFSTTITNSIGTKMPLAGGEFTGDVTCENITPDGDSSRNLGTNSVRFANVYADNFVGGGGNLTGVSSFVSGMILLWSGAINNIPSGWVLCDGNSSTPNLQDRFVVGAGNSYSVGDTGGASSVTLSTSQIPAHSHTMTVTDPGHYHTTNDYVARAYYQEPRNIGSATDGNCNYTGDTNTKTTGISVSAGNTGGGGSHENRPPYYALAYIMKT
ncbi:hypothetical protein [Hyphomonas sp.]|uniref:hypothetical protein n=1 Tax=Hyphomonas sp. TaxID=87 RepID=UPI0025C6DD8B|nr:hypothetical protein [Hyphomonas sp.]